ncbi:GspH/FimT family pseudopilin [Thiobacillus sedimenti]|uniref:Type II secretion system protein H n=1 Tax=Thiobacillus sedimenti TaxID=3110231 RepID=A0ABZ1CH74_9PROT|nr:GspH/FimT family pseudopilin [Thiobacillus sp. SCUT-2]WRS38393.1 GspH/FimT family pseudopilin [Thiobacillus sp. SCUT-2]
MQRRGFTLVELLVGLAVGAILLAIALPGYAYLARASRLAAITNDLLTALQLARSEAIKRGTRVTVCKTADAESAVPACDAAAGWHEGWLVFVDGGAHGVIDVNDQVLRAQAHSHRTVSITANATYGHYISYRPDGTSQGSGGLPNGTLQICADGDRRDIIINHTGRPRLQSGSC